MTVTLGTSHDQVILSEAISGRKIGKGNAEDLRDLNRALIHEFAANGSTALAVLNVPSGITTATAVYATIARAKVRVPCDGVRLNLHIYGNQSRVRVYVGTVLLGSAAVTGTSNAWASMGAVNLSGATFDADGFVIVEMQLQDTTGTPTGTPTLYHAVLAEERMQSANLPTVGNAQTSFVAMHDELYSTADDPVDAFSIQKLDENADQLVFDRSRRICQLMPLFGNVQQLVRLSSCYWRLDGPYTIQVPPYASEGLTVNFSVVTSASPALDMEVFALTEFEDFETKRVERAQTLTSGTTNYIAQSGLNAKAGEPCMVWIAFKCAVDTGAATTTVAGFSCDPQTPQTMYTQRNATLHAAALSPDGIPWGYVAVLDAEDVAASKDPAIKNALGYSTPEQILDIACVQGEDNSGGTAADRADLLTISPHSGTGVTRRVETGAVFKWWTAAAADTVSTPAMTIRRCAIGFLAGVYVECGPATAPARRKVARGAQPPSAAQVASVANRTNQMVFHGNSQVLLRHLGARNLLSDTLIGGTKPLYYAGGYLFCEGSGAGTATGSYLWTIPIAEPNISGGQQSLTLWARFVVMGTMWSGRYPQEDYIAYRVRFSTGSWTEGSIVNMVIPSHGSQQSPTQADTFAAMTSTSVEVGSSPQQTTANAYGQCYTWPSEGATRRMPWQYTVPFYDDSQPSFPTILTAEIEPLGGASGLAMACQIAVAGLHVWWGPREE